MNLARTEKLRQTVLSGCLLKRGYPRVETTLVWRFVGPEVLFPLARIGCLHGPHVRRCSITRSSSQVAIESWEQSYCHYTLYYFLSATLFTLVLRYLYILSHASRGCAKLPHRILLQPLPFIIPDQSLSSDFVTGIKDIVFVHPMLRSQHRCQVEVAINQIQ